MEKQEMFSMLLMLPLHLAIMPVSCSFFVSLFSSHSLQPLFRNYLIRFLLYNL